MLDRLEVPVIAAPMAGGASTPELVAEVGRAGGLGFLAAGYLSVEAVAEQVTATTALTDRPFGVNLFVPGPQATTDLSDYRDRVKAQSPTEPGEPRWDDDSYAAKLELVLALRVPVVSFTFGLPNAEDVHRLHAAGATVVVTVTTPQEAAQAAQVGADVAAVITAGAVAAQLGTAFLPAPEAGTSAAHRQALAEGTRRTALTRAFSGRPARGLVNRFLTQNQDQAPAAYPEVHHLTKPVRATGDPELMSLWAGQTYPLVRPAPAAEIVARLVSEARQALSVAITRI